MTRPAAVLFDLDGTLLDSAPDLALATNRLRAQYQLPALPLADYRPHVGSGARGMLRVAFGLTPQDPDFAPLREAWMTAYADCLLTHTRVFDGVAELIAALNAAALPWGVVTNKGLRFAEPITARLTAFATMGALVGGDSTPHAKPHPAPLLEGARRLGVEPGACVYVGDDPRDITAGHAAGMRTVAVGYGYLGDHAPPSQWGAHALIDHPLDLLAHLGVT